MSFLLSIGLVAAAAVMVILGAVQGSPVFYTTAAIASGVAVFLLWRRAAAEKEHIFLSDAPPMTRPNWDRPVKQRSDKPPSDDDSKTTIGLEDERQLGIARYDELVAAEIMSMLETLSSEQLLAVLRHEQAGLARDSIIERIRRLIDLTNGIDVDRTPTPAAGNSLTGPGRGRRPQRNSLQKDGPELSL